jgi:hypothetical protein
MRNLFRWYRARHLAPLMLAVSAVMLLAGGAAVMCFPDPDSTKLASLAGMRAAYDRVVPGRTLEKDLAHLGFDTERYHAVRLSQLGVQEYFMPGTSKAFDKMDASVRACFDSRDRCRALVFPLAPDSSGLIAAHAARPGKMVFLLRHGKVAYKAVEES